MNSKAPDIVKERPILFSGPMVRAILEGRKTQTRRVAKGVERDNNFHKGNRRYHVLDIEKSIVHCPYGKPGDRLWVRETFADIGPRLTYRADKDDGAHCMVEKWTPSIFMPRWASRITLEITDVRVERLNDISKIDAGREGCPFETQDCRTANTNPIYWFRDLWESINGTGSWSENPWVWVVEFKRVNQ